MATEQPNPRALLFENTLKLYRRTLKRFRPAHQGIHWVMTHAVIPALQAARGFRTMPDDPFWFRIELLTNRHEPETVTQFKQLVKQGMTVLDIGAHVGYYSRLASDLVGPNGRVIAFEPHPRNFQYLERNTSSLTNITRLPVALAAEEGTAELYDYLMMSASGSLNYDAQLRDTQLAQTSQNDLAPRMDADFEPQIYTVRTASADDLLAEQGIDTVDVIKMDIEGAELGALRGLQQTIAHSPNLALVMEYNPMGLQAFGHEPEAALREVRAMGFQNVHVIEASGSLTALSSDTAQIPELTQRLLEHMGVVNLLFTR